MKFLVYSAKDFEIPYLKKANKGINQLTFIKESLTLKTAFLSKGYDAISIFSADDASSEALKILGKLNVRFITLRSTGFDNVDLEVAKSLKIKVANVPAYSPNAIAEHAVTLLMTLNRKIIESNRRIKNLNFDLNGLIGFDLIGKTIGIIGTGRIGAVMAKIMYGFGCKLLGYDVQERTDLSRRYNLKYTSLKQLCQLSDVISIHVPLNDSTYHLIDEGRIKLMRKGVIIINTSRGAVVDTEAIVNGLEENSIGAIGLDVYEHEKQLFFKNRSNEVIKDKLFTKLNNMPNVLITGHHAYLTREALTNIANSTFYNLNCWKENALVENEISTNN